MEIERATVPLICPSQHNTMKYFLPLALLGLAIALVNIFAAIVWAVKVLLGFLGVFATPQLLLFKDDK